MRKEFVPASAMVIVAHPDDIEFGCAGTCAKWAKHGAKIVYVLVTSGNSGTHDPAHTRETIAALREQEQRAAAEICGVHEVEFLRYNDGEVMPTLELRKDLVRMIRKHKPEVVIAMDPTRMYVGKEYINHPDHRAVAIATMDAVAPIAAMPLMYPELGPAHKVREVWIQWVDDPDTWVDISDTLELKVRALLQHKSQVSEEVAQRVRDWAFQEGKGLIPAEAFKVIVLEKRGALAGDDRAPESKEAAMAHGS
ncbi:MAG: PIG-L family deacetylase [Thermoflexales bacterium]|nr:PIG-L family deacetylase [Thermoflexales bacterium]MDW8350841.1 PIG-L deacetylase family protein [Anaerolineae bacterium]